MTVGVEVTIREEPRHAFGRRGGVDPVRFPALEIFERRFTWGRFFAFAVVFFVASALFAPPPDRLACREFAFGQFAVAVAIEIHRRAPERRPAEFLFVDLAVFIAIVASDHFAGLAEVGLDRRDGHDFSGRTKTEHRQERFVGPETRHERFDVRGGGRVVPGASPVAVAPVVASPIPAISIAAAPIVAAPVVAASATAAALPHFFECLGYFRQRDRLPRFDARIDRLQALNEPTDPPFLLVGVELAVAVLVEI